MSSNRREDKLTFFENIYYWFWYYLPKNSERWHHTPEALGCTFLSILKGSNFLWLIMLLGALLKKNIFTSIFGEFDGKLAVALTFIPLILLLGWYDERRYEQRSEEIVKKFKNLTPRKKLNKKIFFFIYVLLSITIWSFANTLVQYYST